MPAPAPTIQVCLQNFADMDGVALQSLLQPADRLGLGAQPALQQRQLLGRAYRRQMLAAALGLPPAAVVLSHSPHGKPQLSPQRLAFNCSHSRSAYALAWSYGVAALGVDTEDESRAANMAGIAAETFSTNELAAWDATGRSPLAWLVIWTRKEAALKCLGTGIRISMAAVETGSPVAATSLVDGPCGRLRLRSWRRRGQVLSLAHPADATATIVIDTGATGDAPSDAINDAT